MTKERTITYCTYCRKILLKNNQDAYVHVDTLSTIRPHQVRPSDVKIKALQSLPINERIVDDPIVDNL